MLYRRSFEAECPVASLSERCEAYRLAYIQEVQRNGHLVQQNSHLAQAYGALSGQHGIVLHELAALASQYCLLEKELFDALKVFTTPSAAPAEPAQQVAVRPAAAQQGGAR